MTVSRYRLESNAAPMPGQMPMLVLKDRVNGWWTGLPRRCQHGVCGGRLVIVPPELLPGRVECLSCGREVAEVIYKLVDLGPIDMTPSPRGRPPSPPPPVKYCSDCLTRAVSKSHERCLPCAREYRTSTSLKVLLVAELSHGRPVHRIALCDALGIGGDSLRQVVKKARMAGHRILLKAGTYRMEVGG